MSSETILLTGASGYVGGRLLRCLEEGGRTVRCLARDPHRIAATRTTTEIVAGDCLDPKSLERACEGVHTAYYLVHSMAAGARFAELDRRAALNFGRAAAGGSVRRIVYLGGLADDIHSLSTHLRSRAETGEALRAGQVPVIEFRASIIIGDGSLSFEMIRALVERLPIMVCPRWVDTLAQPIAIDDVVAYLAAALNLPYTDSRVFEIGGPQIISYGGIMREYARLRGLRRLFMPVPFLTPHLSGLWLALITPAQARVGRALVEGLRNQSIVRSRAADGTFAVRAKSLPEALAQAIEEGSASHRKVDTRTVIVDAPPSQAFAPIRRIGGASGWYYGNALWTIRGWMDRRLGGVGMNRGRCHPDHCALGDTIDGWTVQAYERDRRLRLGADLRLPGRGWLEFEVAPIDDGRRSLVRQTATFDPRGLLGRVYWYAILPLHALLFRGLLRRIAQLGTKGDRRIGVSIFEHRSVVPGPADDVFEWHERANALLDLMPSRRLVRIETRTGGLRDGGRVRFSIGVGPLRMGWEARHYGYVPGRRFCDEQVRGPFKLWRHTHRVEAIDSDRSLYVDRIEYALPGGALARRLFDRLVHWMLERLFIRRHQIVRARFAGEGPHDLSVRNVIE